MLQLYALLWSCVVSLVIGNQQVLDIYYEVHCPDSKQVLTNQIPRVLDEFVFAQNRTIVNLVPYGKASVKAPLFKWSISSIIT